MSSEVELSDEERAELLNKCDHLREEIVMDGESAEKMVRLANVQLKLGERDEAIMSLQTALRLRPGTEAILYRLKQVCTEEELAEIELPEEVEPFWHSIPELLRYPLSGSGVYLLIGGTVFVTILEFIISLPTLFFYASVMVSIFLSGYLSSYFISVMRSSAQGRDAPPDWPDITDIGGNVLWPLFVISVPGIISFLPAAVYLVYRIFSGGSIYIMAGLIAAGALYYPMALIASAITGAPMNSMNFIGVIASILRVRKEYFIAELMLALFAGVSIVVYLMVAVVTEAMAGAIIAGFAVRFVYLYFLMVFAHILGLLYRQCESRINPS